MKDKTKTTETVESTVSNSPEVNSTPGVPTYNPDDYIEEELVHNDVWYYSEDCFSCKHWRGNGCGSPSGLCSYKSF